MAIFPIQRPAPSDPGLPLASLGDTCAVGPHCRTKSHSLSMQQPKGVTRLPAELPKSGVVAPRPGRQFVSHLLPLCGVPQQLCPGTASWGAPHSRVVPSPPCSSCPTLCSPHPYLLTQASKTEAPKDVKVTNKDGVWVGWAGAAGLSPFSPCTTKNASLQKSQTRYTIRCLRGETFNVQRTSVGEAQ